MTTYVKISALVPISRLKACWLIVCGPGDADHDPLAGTRFDPIVRERVRAANRHARLVRRQYRRMSPQRLREPASERMWAMRLANSDDALSPASDARVNGFGIDVEGRELSRS